MPYYRRGYRSRWPYRSWRRFGVSSAQKSGTRRFSISIPVEGYTSIGVAANSHLSLAAGFTPFYSSSNQAAGDVEITHHNATLVGNSLFTTYCQLYDEVKLNSVAFSISVDQTPTGTNGVKIVSCIDRHVTLDDIRANYTVGQMSASAEADSRMFSSLQNARMYRYFGARDVGERTSFFDCSLGTQSYTVGQNTYNMAGPLEFIKNNSLFGCFNPIIFVGFSFSSAPSAAGVVYCQYKVTYNLTFRNPKYGGYSSSKGEGFSDMKSELIEEVKAESEDKKFDEIAERVIKKMKEGDGDVVVVKREKDELLDDEAEEDDDEMESQKEPTREELLEMLAKYKKEGQ